MKVTIPTADLKAALAQVSRVVKSNSTLPALACVLLEAHVDGGLTLSGTDLETRAIRTVGATVTAHGAVCLPLKLFAAFVGELSAGDCTISVAANHRATITSGPAEIVLPGLDAENFPVGGDFDEPSAELTLAADVFASAVAAVAHAVAPDESRPVLAGVYLTVQDGTLTLVAADGFRLGLHRVHELPDTTDLSVIVQGKPLGSLIGALSAATSVRLALNANGSMVLLDTEVGLWQLRVMDGQFPDFNRIIPKQTQAAMTVDRAALLSAVKLVAPVARDNQNITRLTLNGPTLTVRAATGTETAETTVTVDPIRGEDGYTWALNNTYLRDAIEAYHGSRVTLESAGVASPSMVHDGDVKSGVQIVMAMRVAK